LIWQEKFQPFNLSKISNKDVQYYQDFLPSYKISKEVILMFNFAETSSRGGFFRSTPVRYNLKSLHTYFFFFAKKRKKKTFFFVTNAIKLVSAIKLIPENDKPFLLLI
jgi:hypothetical protein